MKAAGFVYFARCGSAVKIGWSHDVEARLRELQTGSPEPLVLLAVHPGPIEQETQTHRRFRHLRLRGEWFRAEDELVAFALSGGTNRVGAWKGAFGDVRVALGLDDEGRRVLWKAEGVGPVRATSLAAWNLWERRARRVAAEGAPSRGGVRPSCQIKSF